MAALSDDVADHGTVLLDDLDGNALIERVMMQRRAMAERKRADACLARRISQAR